MIELDLTQSDQYTKKQEQALDKFGIPGKVYHLHYGGARSGKTFLDCDLFINRAIKYPGTRQLICRASKASCINSSWMQTLIPILEKDYPGLWYEDKTKRIINFINKSSIWAGGFDNVQHKDELLAKEWAGILIEEATELGYQNFMKLLTRLNWDSRKSDIPLKMILECNPTTPSSWIYKYFYKNIDHETNQKLSKGEIDQLSLQFFSPEDNIENLSELYIDKLRSSRGMMRKRFYEGVWAETFEGQVYDFDRSVNLVEEPIQYNEHYESWRAWDFGISPSKTSIIWLQVMPVPKSTEFPKGVRINVIEHYENMDKKYTHYGDYVTSRAYKNENFYDAGDPAGEARNESLESWISKLKEYKIFIKIPKGDPSPDDYISNANQWIHALRVCERQCPGFVEAIENWSKPKDKDGKVIGGKKPEHNEYSHTGTALYYWFMVKFPTKKGAVFLP